MTIRMGQLNSKLLMESWLSRHFQRVETIAPAPISDSSICRAVDSWAYLVGRIMKAAAVPVGMSWMWTLAFGHHEDRPPTHGYAATHEAAMAAFAKSWRRE